MTKLRLREVNKYVQGHTVYKSQTRYLTLVYWLQSLCTIYISLVPPKFSHMQFRYYLYYLAWFFRFNNYFKLFQPFLKQGCLENNVYVCVYTYIIHLDAISDQLQNYQWNTYHFLETLHFTINGRVKGRQVSAWVTLHLYQVSLKQP